MYAARGGSYPGLLLVQLMQTLSPDDRHDFDMLIPDTEIDAIYTTNTTSVTGPDEINRLKRPEALGDDPEIVKERVEVSVSVLYTKFFTP